MMEEFITQVPKTALDVFRMLPEGTLCEVINDALFILPTPTYKHQRIAGLLARYISNHLDKTGSGIVTIYPVDVYFEELNSAVQPDVMYISNENMHILHDDEYFYGVPDLIIEVLSSDKNRDRVQKKSLYERAGVKEYFIVNPANRNVIAYSLQEGSYQLVYQTDSFFKSAILDFEFWF